MDRGSTYYAPTGETTEWDDILIKKGITTREEVLIGKGLNPADFEEKEEPVFEEDPQDPLAGKTLAELDELEDEIDDDRALQAYRSQRLAEMRERFARERFGEVIEINKEEWVREVTEASNSAVVVVHLYQDSVIECRLMHEALSALARKFRQVKFVKIRSVIAVENWPDANLPTLFVYQNGAMSTQLITARNIGGVDMTADDVEWWLAEKGIVETELEANPHGGRRMRMDRVGRRTVQGDDDDDDA